MSLLVRNRPYRLLFSASAISNLGDGIAALAFPWLVTLITRDPMALAVVAVAVRLPWLVFAIPAGALVDRGDRRRLMVHADLIRLLLTLGVIGLVLAHPPDGHPNAAGAVAMLAGLAFLIGMAEVIRDNAAQTLLPAIVPKTDLEAANGQLWSIEQVMASFVGPPLAGVLIALAVPIPFAANALCFGLAAWLVWMIALPPRSLPPRRRLWVEIAEGWVWMRQHVTLLRLAVMLGLMNAMATMVLTVLVLISQDILGLGSVGHGVLLTAGAAGGVAGGLLCPGIIARIGPTRAVLIALALFPLPYAAIAITSSPLVVAAALFLEMFAALLWNTVTVSWRQRLIPDDILGRVNSIYRAFGWGMMPLGALAAGALITLTGPTLGHDLSLRLPVALAALGSVAMAVYGWGRLRL